MAVNTASAGPICCVIVSQWPSRANNRGLKPCTSYFDVCARSRDSGARREPLPCPKPSEMHSCSSILRSSSRALLRTERCPH